MSDIDLDVLFERVSNWGRWGPDDQLGTLNHLRPEHALAAMANVRNGAPINCGRTLSPLHPAGSAPLLHMMTATGYDARPVGKSIIADWLGFGIHGYGLTHLDAPSHEAWNGMLYNGRPATVVGSSGAGWGSVELASNRIVGRGVLLDVPRATGQEYLEPGTALTPADLEACAATQVVELRPGDILMIRTGRDVRAGSGRDFDLRAHGAAGLAPECLPWLREKAVSVLVSDAVHDPIPSRHPSCDTPIHAIGIVAMGLWLLDNAHLEALSAACARNGQWECLFVCPVLPIKRATGSPVNPLAFL